MPSTLIIGGSRGLGLEFVRQYLSAGTNVFATARKESDLAALKELGAHPVALDVACEESVSSFTSRFDSPDLTTVIHNAGVFGPEHGTDCAVSEQQFDSVMHANVFGPLALIPQLGPMLSATQGRYVFLSSDMASIAAVNSSHGALYRASKAALNMTVRCASLDFPMVTFTCMSPGWVRTDMGGNDAPLSAEESVRGMIAVIETTQNSDTGAFVDYSGTQKTW